MTPRSKDRAADYLSKLPFDDDDAQATLEFLRGSFAAEGPGADRPLVQKACARLESVKNTQQDRAESTGNKSSQQRREPQESEADP